MPRGRTSDAGESRGLRTKMRGAEYAPRRSGVQPGTSEREKSLERDRNGYLGSLRSGAESSARLACTRIACHFQLLFPSSGAAQERGLLDGLVVQAVRSLPRASRFRAVGRARLLASGLDARGGHRRIALLARRVGFCPRLEQGSGITRRDGSCFRSHVAGHGEDHFLERWWWAGGSPDRKFDSSGAKHDLQSSSRKRLRLHRPVVRSVSLRSLERRGRRVGDHGDSRGGCHG